MEVQTRSEVNGLSFFSNKEDAYNAAKKDSTIWKISYEENGKRIRMVKQENGSWLNEPLDEALAKALKFILGENNG